MELIEREITAFLERHGLPGAYREMAEKFFLPLVKTLPSLRTDTKPLLLGINGAQGTGKSTLADFISVTASSALNWNIAVLSIDDFYRTRAERAELATSVHRLFATRGVPGTHDVEMLERCLDSLERAGNRSSVALPRFDKAIDDRVDSTCWPVVTGKPDLVILEGWCVGSRSQPEERLLNPINDLEANEDSQGVWRRYVNDQLRNGYARVFERLDTLIFLKAPSFAAILRWRLEQEDKLRAESDGDTSGLMNETEIIRFIQHYERITRANLESMSTDAQFVFELDESHGIARFKARDSYQEADA